MCCDAFFTLECFMSWFVRCRTSILSLSLSHSFSLYTFVNQFMVILSPDVIQRIEMKSLSGDYSDEDKKPRSRKKPLRFIDESSREVTLKSKPKPKPKPKHKSPKKRESNFIDDSDSDSDSIAIRKSRICKGPKHLRLIDKLEKDEKKRSNSFLALSEDEDSSVDLNTLSMKANDNQLIDGEDVGQKIRATQKQQSEERLIQKKSKQSNALSDIKKRKFKFMHKSTKINSTFDSSSHVTNNYNINIDNSGSTSIPWSNSLPNSAISAASSWGSNIFRLQQMEPNSIMQQQQLNKSQYDSTTNSKVESLLQELSCDYYNHTWISFFREALHIRNTHGFNGLRRGYNAINHSVADWYARQRISSHIDQRKRMLLLELEP